MKKKIFSLLLIFTMFFSFGFTAVEAQAEFVDDNTFVVSNADYTLNEEDAKQLFLFFSDYVETYELEVLGDEIDGYYFDIGNNLYDGLSIDFQADLPSLDYTLTFVDDSDIDLMALAMHDSNEETIFQVLWTINNNEIAIVGIASYDFNVVITLFEEEEVEEPPFTGFINFIGNLLQDLLKNITDMTMDLINNIWDTNLIDINFVILSDTAIFTGTLNDMLYSVFSIFYVIFAITLVWRLLTKIIKKFTFWERW